MKRMSLSFHDAEDAPRMGARYVPEDPPVGGHVAVQGGERWNMKANSDRIEILFFGEVLRERRRWAQLSIELDGVVLYFWLPAELDHMCDVFAMRPFPTAAALARRDDCENRLNRHWLSRLPKQAKAPKFRARFRAYVASNPKELRAFREFYQG